MLRGRIEMSARLEQLVLARAPRLGGFGKQTRISFLSSGLKVRAASNA